MRSATVAAICGVVAALLVVLVAAPSPSDDESARALNHASSVEDERSEVAPQGTATPGPPESEDWTKTVAPVGETSIFLSEFNTDSRFTGVNLGTAQTPNYSAFLGVEIVTLPALGTLKAQFLTAPHSNQPLDDIPTVGGARFIMDPLLVSPASKRKFVFKSPGNFAGQSTTIEFKVWDRNTQNQPYSMRAKSVKHTLTLVGSGQPVNTPSATPVPMPDKPTGLQAFPGPEPWQVTLRWDNPGDPNIAKYAYSVVLDPKDFTNAYTEIDKSNANTTSHVISGLQPNFIHYFKIVAINTRGSRGTSDEVSAIPKYTSSTIPTPFPPTATPVPTSTPTNTPTPTPPTAPAGLFVNSDTLRFDFHWNDPNDPRITRYEYRQRETSGSFGNIWITIPGSDASTTNFSVASGLVGGTEYEFQLRATISATPGAVASITATAIGENTPVPSPVPSSTPTATPSPTPTPYTRSQAMITRIEPAFNEITVAPGDDVRLRLDFYGLQGIKDSKLATDDVEFAWEAFEDTSSSARQLVGDESTILYRVPSRQGTYTVTASLGRQDCIGRGDDDCTASFVIQTRRSSPIDVPTPLPAPTGEVATRVASDQDGYEYVVINHSQGGGFDQDGYSIRFRPGVVVQGEIVPVRMERLGLADSQNPLDLRHMLGGYRYGIYLPGETQARLNAPGAEVCIPLAAELRASLSRVDLLAIDDTSGNTVLSSFTPISPEQVQVCGNISRLPAEVAAGTFGTPVAVPTQPVEEVLEAPDTGGASPASSVSLLMLVIGLTLATTGVVFISLRRRRTRDGSPS